MFETETPITILNRMLRRVGENVDKRQGSIIYDTLMPLSFELSYIYTACEYIHSQMLPATQDRDNLKMFASTYSINPYPATYATVEAELVTEPDTYIVPNGTRFSGGEVNYYVDSHKEGTTYYLVCETPGIIGNQYYGAIRPIFNVAELVSAKITGISIPGSEEEDTEAFRERVKANFHEKAFGGNYADYYLKVRAIQGVGGVKIIGTPSRQKTLVDIYIIDSEFKKPTEETVAFVQNEVHPPLPDETQKTLESSGLGFAPIGHDVTVRGVRERKININTNLSYREGANWQSVESRVKETIGSFFYERNKEWESQDNIIIRVSAIENAILAVDGIIDIWDTTVNDTDRNITLDFDEIPVLGEIGGNLGA